MKATARASVATSCFSSSGWLRMQPSGRHTERADLRAKGAR
jgi:hypothetical protein